AQAAPNVVDVPAVALHRTRYPLVHPGEDTITLAMNCAFCRVPGVATYMARLPSGACLMNGPPAGSAVVCGCGLPATVPVTATDLSLDDLKHDLRGRAR